MSIDSERVCWLIATGGVSAVNGHIRYVTARRLFLSFSQRRSKFNNDAISGTMTPVRAVHFITIRCMTVTVVC
jgi:hypothetical protein